MEYKKIPSLKARMNKDMLDEEDMEDYNGELHSVRAEHIKGLWRR